MNVEEKSTPKFDNRRHIWDFQLEKLGTVWIVDRYCGCCEFNVRARLSLDDILYDGWHLQAISISDFSEGFGDRTGLRQGLYAEV